MMKAHIIAMKVDDIFDKKMGRRSRYQKAKDRRL
jgi:hypothetical protein